MHRLLLLGATSLLALALSGPAAAWSWPADGDVLRPFTLGSNAYAAGQHRGIDVAGPEGSSIHAPASGTVSFAGSLPTHGRSLTILTSDGYAVTLVHLGSIEVGKGDAVTEGSSVATMGSSGEPEHAVASVHMGVRVASQEEGYVDPLGLLPPHGTLRTPASEAPAPVATPAPAPSAAAATPATSQAPAPPVAPPAPTGAAAALPPAASSAPAGTSAPQAPASSVPPPSAASAPATGPAVTPSPASSTSAPSDPPAPTGSAAARAETIASAMAAATEPTGSSATGAEPSAAFTVSSAAHRRAADRVRAAVSGTDRPVVHASAAARSGAPAVARSGVDPIRGVAQTPVATGRVALPVVHTSGAAPALVRPGGDADSQTHRLPEPRGGGRPRAAQH